MNEKLRKLLEQFQAKSQALESLLGKGDGLTQEDVANAQTLKTEAGALKSQIEAERAVDELKGTSEQMRSWLRDPVNHVDMQPAGNTTAQALGFQQSGEAQISTDGSGKSILEQYGAGVLTETQIKAIKSTDYRKAYTTYLRKGINGLSSAEIKVMQEGIDEQGGFIAPEDIQSRVLMKKPTPTRVAGYVTNINTSRDMIALPRVVYATDDLYTTGVRVTWTGEVPAAATAHRVTEPVWGQFRVPVYTAMLSMPLTNNMVEDAMFDVVGWVSDRFSETIDLLYDNMIINGTGVGQPSGILQNPNGTDEPATVNSGAAAALTGDGVIDLAYHLPEQYDTNARFFFNKTSTGFALRSMQDGAGRYLWGQGLQDSGLAAPVRPTDLLGYPAHYSGFMPNVSASAYPITFGDHTGYWKVNRIGFSIQILRELYAETNQILALGRVRFGGDVGEPWKLKVQVVSA